VESSDSEMSGDGGDLGSSPMNGMHPDLLKNSEAGGGMLAPSKSNPVLAATTTKRNKRRSTGAAGASLGSSRSMPRLTPFQFREAARQRSNGPPGRIARGTVREMSELAEYANVVG
jgi:hypothetical protein